MRYTQFKNIVLWYDRQGSDLTPIMRLKMSVICPSEFGVQRMRLLLHKLPLLGSVRQRTTHLMRLWDRKASLSEVSSMVLRVSLDADALGNDPISQHYGFTGLAVSHSRRLMRQEITTKMIVMGWDLGEYHAALESRISAKRIHYLGLRVEGFDD